MEDKYFILQNDRLKVRVLKSGTRYHRCRYDWSGIVEQVELDGKHSFCSEEQVNGAYGGLGGIGLCSVIEWNDSSLHDSTPIAGNFPILGVGLLKRNDLNHFWHTKEFEMVPFKRIEEQGDTWVKIHTLPQLCQGVAVDQLKTISLNDNALTVTQEFTNIGEKSIAAHEFCHNFMQIDGKLVDSQYKVTLPYQPTVKVRRGEIIACADGYRPGAFDIATNSTAFYLNGYEGLKSHWMILSHDNSPASILIEDKFAVTGSYCWNNPASVCTETYKDICLAPGESEIFERSYTFITNE